MNRKFKLVPKISQDVMAVFYIDPNGETLEICRVLLPNDNQMGDNVICAEEICVALKKRIRKSV
ncbi:MAG: hypothetical protein J6B06_07180 [Lachnospiraceae bacterium]|nr:hypothetical protein [Lachnospiraceae bacterium]